MKGNENVHGLKVLMVPSWGVVLPLISERHPHGSFLSLVLCGRSGFGVSGGGLALCNVPVTSETLGKSLVFLGSGSFEKL